MKDVMPELTAASLRESVPSLEGATQFEFLNWCERISYAQHSKRNGLYMDVLTIPTEIRDAVMAELRERGFFVSSVLEGSVRYNAMGSAFVVRWVYIDWRHKDAQE